MQKGRSDGVRMLALALGLSYARHMLFRALLLLIVVVGLSAVALHYFGKDALIAGGLIFVQLKIILKKTASLEWPVLLVWLKMQGSAFFKIELIKKWLMTTLMPMVLGKALLRRLAGVFTRYIEAVRAQYARMMLWYGQLSTAEKVVSGLILLFASIALSISSFGLWVILFTVKLPLWIIAAGAALGRMIWVTVQKSTFKAVAFLQLGLLWKGLQKLMPSALLKRKRAFDYKVARAVIRKRRMTVRQLAENKDSLPFRMGLLVDYLFGRSQDAGD
ncbi:hypothetical protein C8N36_11444 [Pelagimonas varians]|uniref:Uncharacterized protein n=2 Tax=Pelagimonas varians TaxID=696760 RepID=A0A238KXT0_9RHOB|nr:hypothetical protein C8N36_11444 [Pelagimonas varians]SMX47450.1 hypothetical protein PEV8663_03543 [Pelagimonas varians]